MPCLTPPISPWLTSQHHEDFQKRNRLQNKSEDQLFATIAFQKTKKK